MRRAVRPGFDPTHPAAQGLAGTHGFSAVAFGSGFINLVRGIPSDIVLGASGAAFIINRNGPAFNWPASTTGQIARFPALQVADTAVTLAMIGTYSSSSGGAFLFTDISNTRGFRLEPTGMTMPNTAAVASGLTLPTNVPLFYAASKVAGVGVNFLVLNLATGAVQTSFVTNTNNQSAGGVNFSGIGADASQGQGTPVASVSAALWSPIGLSMPQLLRWAQDPWAFWYPQGPLIARPVPTGIATISGTLTTTDAPDIAALTGDSAAPASVTGPLAATETTDLARMVATSTPPRVFTRPVYNDYYWQAGKPRERPKKWT